MGRLWDFPNREFPNTVGSARGVDDWVRVCVGLMNGQIRLEDRDGFVSAGMDFNRVTRNGGANRLLDFAIQIVTCVSATGVSDVYRQRRQEVATLK